MLKNNSVGIVKLKKKTFHILMSVHLAMVQALSVRYGFDCLGSEEERRRLALLGPEERFNALQIEFIGLAYRLETREMEIRETRKQLEEVTKERDALSMLQSDKSRGEFEERVITQYIKSHAVQALQMHTALEQDRQKLKSAIDADLLEHIPKSQITTLDSLLRAAGVKPRDSSTRARLHTLLGDHKGKHSVYPTDQVETMVLKIKGFAKEHTKHFTRVNPTPIETALPWVGGKRKHPVDKVWDSALERCRPRK
jgi:hypothetical protein